MVGEAARFKQAERRLSQEEFLKHSDRMVFGDSPKQGIVRNNAIYHAELGFTMRFPAVESGWSLAGCPVWTV